METVLLVHTIYWQTVTILFYLDHLRIYLLIILIIPIIIRAETRCSHTVYSDVCLSLSDRPSTSFWSVLFANHLHHHLPRNVLIDTSKNFSVSLLIKGPFFSSNISSSINFNWVLIHLLQKRSSIIIIICITQSTASNFLFIVFLLLPLPIFIQFRSHQKRGQDQFMITQRVEYWSTRSVAVHQRGIWNRFLHPLKFPHCNIHSSKLI